MKSRFFQLLGSLLAATALSSAAFATPISGTITFSGNVQLDSGLATATQVTSWSSGNPYSSYLPYVQSSDGSFSTLGAGWGTPVTFTRPWSFASGPVSDFWTINLGGNVLTFDLSSSWVVSQNSSFVNVSGTGWVSYSGLGYDATAGTWKFTLPGDKSDGKFTFAASVVPEGGETVVMLGISLLVASLVRFRRKAA